MASNTPNLDLYKKDPVADGNDTFNIQTMMNDNWDKIDADKAEQDAAIQEKGTALAAHWADEAQHGVIIDNTLGAKYRWGVNNGLVYLEEVG